jgi:hypothetical protein
MEKIDAELIAEFMGDDVAYILNTGTVFIKPITCKFFKEDEPTEAVPVMYKTSWDWLMPVVEKIYRMPDKDVRFKLENSRCRLWYGHKLFKCHTISPINSVYAVVVEFIKWFNQQKPNGK